MSITIGDKPEINVVNVGDEISLDQLAAIQNSNAPSEENPFATILDASAFNQSLNTTDDVQFASVGVVDPLTSNYVAISSGTGFDLGIHISGGMQVLANGLTFPDSSVQTTAAQTFDQSLNTTDTVQFSRLQVFYGDGTSGAITADIGVTNTLSVTDGVSGTTITPSEIQFSNGTQIAGVATDAEAVAGTSNTLAVTPSGIQAANLGEIVWSVGDNSAFLATTLGVGASASASNTWNRQILAPTSDAGYANCRFTISGHTPNTTWNSPFDFDRQMFVEAMFGRGQGTDLESVGWISIGDGGTIVNNGPPNHKGFGFYISGYQFYGFTHDGTTLTISTDYHTAGIGTMTQAKASSDGLGNVTFDIGGTTFTMNTGPVGLGKAYQNAVTIKAINNVPLTGTRLTLWVTRLKLKIR